MLPSLYHTLVLGCTNLSRLKRIDTLVRAAVRKWLALPHDVINAYIQANLKNGGLSIPSVRWRMPSQRMQRLKALVRNEVQTGSFMAQEIDRARRKLLDGRLEVDQVVLVERRVVGLLHSSNDGKGLKESRNVPTHNQWVTDGTRFLYGRDFVNTTKLRFNALPTKSRTSRGRHESRYCRAGCNGIETLNHVLQICHRTHRARVARYNAIASYVRRALSKQYDLVEE